MDCEQRRQALWEKVKANGLDAFLVLNVESSDLPNLRYLTGFTGSFGVLVLGERTLLLTDSRYTEQARRQVQGLPVEEVKGRWLTFLVERLHALGVKRVGLGTYRTSLYLYQEMGKLAQGVELVPQTGLVEELRRTKAPEEVERIHEAIELTERGLQEILGRVKRGRTERDLALELEFWYRQEGAEDVAFELIVASGPGSSMPHYRAGGRNLAGGDVVLFDIGVRIDGYCSDLTRVVALGSPSPQVKEVYELVLEANKAGLDAVKAGRSGQEVDRAARQVIEAAGKGERFGHGLGHGLGMEVHEAPRVAPTSEDVLSPGDVVTVEPGVYLPGEFGIRIEDVVVVTDEGCRVLTSFPKDELIVL